MSGNTPTPGERLALSRERLRVAMQPRQAPASSLPMAGVLELLKTAAPSASLLIDAFGAWWAHSPLRSLDGVAAAVRPLAQRRPLQLAGVALAAGLLIAWIRPWRLFMPRRAAMAPSIVPTVLSTLLTSALASGALQDFLRSAFARPPEPPTPPEPPPPDLGL